MAACLQLAERLFESFKVFKYISLENIVPNIVFVQFLQGRT